MSLPAPEPAAVHPAEPLLSLARDEPQAPWRERARCRGMGPELFYGEDAKTARAAKAVCRACPVRRECLDHALAAGEVGVWGGTTQYERRALRRRLRRPA